LYQIHLESGTTASIAERELVRRVEAHTGRKVGNWEVKYSLYGPTSERRAASGGANSGANANSGGNNGNNSGGGMINLEAISSSETGGRIVLIAGTRVVEAESSSRASRESRAKSNIFHAPSSRTA